MLQKSSIFFWLSIVLTAAACSESGGGDGDGDACAPGSEGCPCDNGTCDGDLECRSNLCVEGGGTGGATGGTSGAGGTTGTGGTSSGNGGSGGGTGGATGGSSGSSTGGAPAGMGGTQSTGGAGNSGAGSGGAAGTGGSTPCTDTMSDPDNCGTCGHVCESRMCRAGVCDPSAGPCFDETSGFTTCEASCQSVGEMCARNSCGTVTHWSWPAVERPYCEMNIAADMRRQANCDAVITFDGGQASYRCCCTDTH